jgi:hypothetical protein
MPTDNSMNMQKILHTNQITCHNIVILQLMYTLIVLTNFKSGTLVEGTRHYVAFVYLCETAHRHVTEGSNFIDVLGMTLWLFSLEQIMTSLWCII